MDKVDVPDVPPADDVVEEVCVPTIDVLVVAVVGTEEFADAIVTFVFV